MGNVLRTPQREQSGSDSYNRFEYQTHWIVYHIINQLNQKSQCIVFCEFQDDMSQSNSGVDDKYDFYQIKTKEENKEWTLSEISKKEKNKDGTPKKSFLGHIFYSFLQFADNCSNCFFISNNKFDSEIRSWQACIEDGYLLKSDNPDLYKKIRCRIEEEYKLDALTNFDEIYDKFIQNTYIQKSDLQLETFENQVSGKFFEFIQDKTIPANTANLILKQIISDVRKKSKKKIDIPISFKSLVGQKGIRISDIDTKITIDISNTGEYDQFETFLKSSGLNEVSIKRIIEEKRIFDVRWLKIDDLLFQKIVIAIREIIHEQLKIDNNISIDEVYNICFKDISKKGLHSESFKKSLVEVLIYENKYNKK